MEPSINELINNLEREEAEHVLRQFDEDGPFRYTGDSTGYWKALKLMDPIEVRRHINEMRGEA